MRLIWIVGFALILIVGVSSTAAQTVNFAVTYYNTPDLSGSPVSTTTVSAENDGFYLNWGLLNPEPGVNADNWSARFETELVFEQPNYAFSIGSDDGVRLYIDGILVLDRFFGRTFTSDQIVVNWTAGSHDIVIEYLDGIDLAALSIYWRSMAPGENLLNNSAFDYDIGFVDGTWSVYSTPTASDVTYQIVNEAGNNVFQFYRAPQPPGGNSAVLLQNSGVPVGINTRLEAHFRFGNTSDVRKRTTILVHDRDFSDFFVCSFWLPPNTPLQNYRMLGSAREEWFGASVSIYAASPDGVGWLQVDDAELYIEPVADLSNTLCYEPNMPPPPVETPEVEPVL